MRTAVAAPPDPYGDLFAFIDQMTMVEMARFIRAFRARYRLW
jgi:hypothetical protein